MIIPGLAVLTFLAFSGAKAASFDFTPYFVNVTLDFGQTPAINSTVNGFVNICLKVINPTSVVRIHWGKTLSPAAPGAADLKVTKQADLSVASPVDPVTVSAVDTSQQTLTITTSPASGSTDTTFKANDYINISISFKTIITPQPTGGITLYKYLNSDSSPSNLIVANPGPGSARNMFPCIDDPRLPTAINITLIRPSLMQVDCSLPRTSLREDTSSKTSFDCFNTTSQVLPSSLAFFLTSDMTKTEYSLPLVSSSTVQVWSPKNSDATFLAGTTAFLANYYYKMENLLRSMPQKYIRFVLVPNLPVSNAGMGIVFIRNESYARNYSLPLLEGLYRTNVVPVLTQMVRQFTEFGGNYLTPWSEMFLVKAINRYILATCSEELGIPVNLETDLTVVSRQTALDLDTSVTSSPLLNTAVDSWTSAGVQAYLSDPLVIHKGAVLLNMLDVTFLPGSVMSTIRIMLKKYNYMSTSDFCTELSSAVASSGTYSSTYQAAAMQVLVNWFTSAGYALVNVTGSTTANPSSIQLKMTPFSSGRSFPSEGFYVAVTVASRSDPRVNTLRQNNWLYSKATNPTDAPLSFTATDWIVVNPDSSGYFRATYPEADWKLILNAVATGGLPASPYLDDAYRLAIAGYVSPDFVLTLINNVQAKYFSDLYTLGKVLDDIGNTFWKLSPHYSRFQDFAGPVLNKVNTMMNNGSIDQWERARALPLFFRLMADLNIGDFRKMAAGHLSSMIEGNIPTTVPSSAYDAIVCCGAKYSNLSPQDLWMKISDESSSFYKKHFSAVALGCLPNYKDKLSLFHTMLWADRRLGPHVFTVFDSIAEEQGSEFIYNISFFSPSMQGMMDAGAVANLLRKAARKANLVEQSTSLQPMTTMAEVDDAVKDAAANTIAAINSKVLWLKTNNVTWRDALKSNSWSSGSSSVTNSNVWLSLLLLVPTILKVTL